MDNNVENDVGENEGIEGQTAWRPDPLKLKVQSLNISEDPLTLLIAGTDLLDISQDPAVLACGNVVPGEEVLDTTLTFFELLKLLTPPSKVEYLSGHCLPRLLPPSAPPMIGGVQVTADIKQEVCPFSNKHFFWN